jgi:hypothetical protein
VLGCTAAGGAFFSSCFDDPEAAGFDPEAAAAGFAATLVAVGKGAFLAAAVALALGALLPLLTGASSSEMANVRRRLTTAPPSDSSELSFGSSSTSSSTPVF